MTCLKTLGSPMRSGMGRGFTPDRGGNREATIASRRTLRDTVSESLPR